MEVKSSDTYQDAHEDSHSLSSCSSSCSYESELRLPWLSSIEADGSLFYIQYNTHNLDSLSEDSAEQIYVETSDAIHKPKKSTADSIKRWMKQHGKSVKKLLPSFKPPRTTTLSIYVSKDVFIDIEPLKSADNEANLSEQILGLGLGSENVTCQPYDKVCVKGFVAGSYFPDIEIGDWVKSINEIDINCGNFENILKEIKLPSEVKLTLMTSQKPAKSQSIPEKHDSLVRELSGDPDILEKAKITFQSVPHGLFFFSLKDEMLENEDVIYCYPGENTSVIHLKGLFLTLNLMIDDVATPPLLSSSIMVQDQLLHVTFIKEEENVMALAFPAKLVTIEEVQLFCSSLAKIFQYLFSSLEKSFSSNHNKNFLDNFLISFFKHYLSPLQKDSKHILESYLLDILPSAKWIPLPSNLLTEIDAILSELESADFGNDSRGFYKNTRIYNIHGSCLFFKGCLISSTLPKDDLLDVHRFLNYSHILELTEVQPVSQLIIWREIFPSQFGESSNEVDIGMPKSRWFLNVVAMEQFILAVVFYDGGCALKVVGQPSPDPFYVQEITNALLVMEAGGILSAIEEQTEIKRGLLSEELNSSSSVFTSNYSLNSSGPNLSSDCSASYSNLGLRKGSSENNFSSQRSSLTGSADGESDCSSKHFDATLHVSSQMKCRSASESTIESCESAEIISMKDQPAQNFSSSLPNLFGRKCSAENLFLQCSAKTAFRIGKNVFFYLHMDPVEGVYTSPYATNLVLPDSIDRDIVLNFHKICLKMRVIFERSLRSSQLLVANAKTKYGTNKFPLHTEEQGFSFMHRRPASAKKKISNTLQFWVVGRLFFAPEPREVYVCYQSDVPHDVVEMAFHLGFGLSF